ncbi:MAG: efflux RND transporter periplasmic adaptor subunit [Pseudomonadota bacterium]
MKSYSFLLIGILFSAAALADMTPVRVAAVEPGEFFDAYEAIGTTAARDSVELTSKVAGIVTAVHFHDGQVVESGDVLLQLDDREIQAELDIARIEAADHLRELQQLETLKVSGATQQAEIDRRRTQYDVAVQRIEQLTTRIADYTIRAPFAGMLGLARISEGALVTPGDLIVTLDSVQSMELDFTVPTTWLMTLKLGQELSISADAFQGRPFDARIVAIDSRVDPVSRSIKVRATVDNSEELLLPGLLMRVDLRSEPRSALVVPEVALVPRQDRQYVYLLDSDLRVVEQEVTIGARRPGEVEILSGLVAGVDVVSEGLQSIRPGQRVRILEPAS